MELPEGFKNYIELLKVIPKKDIEAILKEKLRLMGKTNYEIDFLRGELERRSLKDSIRRSLK